MSQQRMTVCIIGAGVAGLAATRECLREGLDVTVYEQSDGVGGVWDYNNPLARGGAYASLRTNLPTTCMSFSGFDFSLPSSAVIFPGHAEVKAYLNAFADAHDLRRHIRFRRAVVSCRRDRGKWIINDTDVFDAVLVCNGHFNVPYIPAIPGIADAVVAHSVDYRTPEHPISTRGKSVLIIGTANSGVDIALDVCNTASRVILAGESRFLSMVVPAPGDDSDPNRERLPSNIILAPPVTSFDAAAGVAVTADGMRHAVDCVFLCTGYLFSFPFLTPAVASIDTSQRKAVLRVYQHVFPVGEESPTLAFIGLPHFTLPFAVAEHQARWVARVLTGRAAPLPSVADMRAAVDEQIAAAPRLADIHVLGMRTPQYIADLCRLAGPADGSPAAAAALAQEESEWRDGSALPWRHFLAALRARTQQVVSYKYSSKL